MCSTALVPAYEPAVAELALPGKSSVGGEPRPSAPPNHAMVLRLTRPPFDLQLTVASPRGSVALTHESVLAVTVPLSVPPVTVTPACPVVPVEHTSVARKLAPTECATVFSGGENRTRPVNVHASSPLASNGAAAAELGAVASAVAPTPSASTETATATLRNDLTCPPLVAERLGKLGTTPPPVNERRQRGSWRSRFQWRLAEQSQPSSIGVNTKRVMVRWPPS